MKSSSPKNTIKSASTSALILEKLPGYFLLSILLVLLWLLFTIFEPFITALFVGAVLTIAFFPIFNWIREKVRGWNRLAAILTILLVVLLILIPLSIFVVLLVGEAVNTYQLVRIEIESGLFDKYLMWEDGGFFYDLKERVGGIVDWGAIDIKSNIINLAQGLSDFLVSQLKNILSAITEIIISLLVMLFSMYYFFKDGDSIVKKLGNLSPLPSVYEGQLFAKIKGMVKAVVFGVFVTAIAQGLVGGIGFAIAGISNPVFWGTSIAFFSLVPVVGTAIIWVPAVIVLLIMGSYWMALFLFLWGVFAIGSVDNILRPYLIGGKVHTYPLLTFLVVLGGVMTLGLKGVIIGPLILIVLMSFLHIYESEYQRVLKK